MSERRLVLGIDPGTHHCGYGLVYRHGSRFVHVAHGVAEGGGAPALPERLRAIGDTLEQVVREHAPAVVALEQAFVYRDARAALMLGHARGVAMLIAARAGLAVAEYPPSTVKRAVVGSGKAEKAQVNGMIRAILGLAEVPSLDASDALAVAICHAGALALPAPEERTGPAAAMARALAEGRRRSARSTPAKR